MSLIEIASCLCAIVIAKKILTNSLPSYLEFLKGRMGLANAMGITGISVLTLNSIALVVIGLVASQTYNGPK